MKVVTYEYISIGKVYAYHNKNLELKFKTYVFSYNAYLQYTSTVILFGYGEIIENRWSNSEIQLLAKLFNLRIIKAKFIMFFFNKILDTNSHTKILNYYRKLSNIILLPKKWLNSSTGNNASSCNNDL